MSAHSRSALKTSSLSKENERLSKEIQKMETVLKRHRHILNAEEDSLRGQIRKEVGGAKWVTGARGQLTGYKSSKTLGKYPASKSEPKKKSRTQENVYRGETKASATAKEKNQRVTPSNPDMPSLGQTSNPGLKSEGRTYQGLSAKGIRVGKSPNINNVEAVDDANGTAPYSERIATMKAKVLAKASAKVKTPKKESSPKSVESDGEMTKVMQGDAESKIDSTLTSNIIENIRDPPTKDPIHICIPAPGVSSSSESNDGETSTSIITQQICAQNNLKEHVTSTSEISQTRDGRKNENLKLECNASGSESESQDSESRKIIPKIVDGEEEVNADRVSVPLRLNNEPRTNANRPHPDKDPLLYDPVLSVWMYGLKLLDTEQYIRVFVENEVTMKRLKLLNEKQLREFGITSPGPLSKIMHGIKLLNKEVTACSQKFDLQRASSEMSSTRRDQAKQNNIKEYHSSAGSVTIEASGGHGHTSTEMCSQNIEARQVRSADTTGIEKKIPKIRPVSSNVTQRTLASGIHAASHKLKRQRELQEKEKQHQEKIQKLKKAERDKMAAQFHLRKKINKENKRRKSSSSDEVMSDRTHDSEHNSDGIEDLLAVYTK
ncbi:uncharacterized protein LOC102801136, partial [Saccoglossus kowalevskii]|uniref:Uncharacterized protein LOC102801136 n=1 Tax=Saccoglossus kowalevskii TaxID=10224 RepID=A0ABM0MRU3_SACKO